MGIGISFFTEAVGAGPRKHMDILGLGMADGAELRVHPTGKAVLRISVQTQGQGHETTFAQIVAQELGIPADDVEVVHGDTDQTPFGLGTYGSRSTPVSGAATAWSRGRSANRARIVAGAMLEASPEDLEWKPGRWAVRGDPSTGVTMQEIAMAAHGSLELPEGVEGHLDATTVYNPPNLTYPFGAYVASSTSTPAPARSRSGGSSRWTTAASGSTRWSSRGRCTAASPTASGWRSCRSWRSTRTATTSARRSWTTCCRPRWSARRGSWARPSPRPRTIRWAPRASASPPRSARPPRSSTRWWTRSGRTGPARRHAAHPGERLAVVQGRPFRTDLAIPMNGQRPRHETGRGAAQPPDAVRAGHGRAGRAPDEREDRRPGARPARRDDGGVRRRGVRRVGGARPGAPAAPVGRVDAAAHHPRCGLRPFRPRGDGAARATWRDRHGQQPVPVGRDARRVPRDGDPARPRARVRGRARSPAPSWTSAAPPGSRPVRPGPPTRRPRTRRPSWSPPTAGTRRPSSRRR